MTIIVLLSIEILIEIIAASIGVAIDIIVKEIVIRAFALLLLVSFVLLIRLLYCFGVVEQLFCGHLHRSKHLIEEFLILLVTDG